MVDGFSFKVNTLVELIISGIPSLESLRKEGDRYRFMYSGKEFAVGLAYKSRHFIEINGEVVFLDTPNIEGLHDLLRDACISSYIDGIV
jgi:hypothetical protein